jgi:hypothetical protein
MPRETPSPIDLPGPARVGPGGLGWASGVIAVATLFLLLTNGVALQGWLYEQTPGPVQAWAAGLADDWVGLTDRLGLGSPRAAMHARWKKAEAARFKGQAPAGE